MSDAEALHPLASLLGIETRHTDALGVFHEPDRETLSRLIAAFVVHYNTVRLHSAIGYVTPKDRLEGRDKDIFDQRDGKLAEAREHRKQARQARTASPSGPTTVVCSDW